MDNISWGYWTQKVSAHIKFKPDRAAVEEELLAHLEDKADALIKGGMLVYDAEKCALASMGDADEVGRQLAAVHKPWLGYLWLWSRRALIVCVIVMLVSTLGAAGRLPLVPREHDTAYQTVTERHEGDEHYTVTRLSPECTDRSDGFAFYVPNAALVCNETYDIVYESEGETHTMTIEERRSLYLVLECSRWLPVVDGLSAFRHFYAVDDLGNVYPGFFERENDEKSLVGNYDQVDLWHSQYDAWISDLAPEAQWVELRYDRDGRDVRLRIDLMGGEGA